jgi:hypothetical protein
MTLLARAALPLLLLAALWPPAATNAQTPEQLAQRCNELLALYDKYNTRRSEGSGGPDMVRTGAMLDCQKGRYAQGIKALEDGLKRSRITVPPPSY